MFLTKDKNHYVSLPIINLLLFLLIKEKISKSQYQKPAICGAYYMIICIKSIAPEGHTIESGTVLKKSFVFLLACFGMSEMQ